MGQRPERDKEPLLIELDERCRASLARLKGARPGGRYLAHTTPDGTIVLVPAVVVALAEASVTLPAVVLS